MIITIDGFGEDQMSREILRVSARAEDPRPALEAVRDDFYAYEKVLFNTQGASGGQRWRPLAESTKKFKRKHGLDPRILHATLSLRNSLTNQGSPDAVSRIERDGAFFGSSVPYGVFHQSSKPRSGVLPRRPPVMLTEAFKRDAIKRLQRWLITGELL